MNIGFYLSVEFKDTFLFNETKFHSVNGLQWHLHYNTFSVAPSTINENTQTFCSIEQNFLYYN
jgi:hypothetical protein